MRNDREWSDGDVQDVNAWLIREADQRVKFFPQRRDGVDAYLRHLAFLPAHVSERNELADRIGPFYSTEGLMQWLQLSEQAVYELVEKNQLLGCITSDDHWVFPRFQFTDSGEVLPGVSQVLEVLSPLRDAWSIAMWFLVVSPDLLDNVSAIDWLKAGRDVDSVVTKARRAIADDPRPLPEPTTEQIARLRASRPPVYEIPEGPIAHIESSGVPVASMLQALAEVKALYLNRMSKTIDEVSDAEEMFLADLRVVLDSVDASEQVNISRVDRYTLDVGGIQVRADNDQEARIRAMGNQARLRFMKTMGG